MLAAELHAVISINGHLPCKAGPYAYMYSTSRVPPKLAMGTTCTVSPSNLELFRRSSLAKALNLLSVWPCTLDVHVPSAVATTEKACPAKTALATVITCMQPS